MVKIIFVQVIPALKLIILIHLIFFVIIYNVKIALNAFQATATQVQNYVKMHLPALIVLELVFNVMELSVKIMMIVYLTIAILIQIYALIKYALQLKHHFNQ
jgi:hypothetical protein